MYILCKDWGTRQGVEFLAWGIAVLQNDKIVQRTAGIMLLLLFANDFGQTVPASHR